MKIILVVILCVLLVFFTYFVLSKPKKQKGGRLTVFYVYFNDSESNYKIIGMLLQQYLPVLNSDGINFLKTTLKTTFNTVNSHILKTPFVFDIENCLTYPLNVLYRNFSDDYQTEKYKGRVNTINNLFDDPTTKFNESHVIFDFFKEIDNALERKDKDFADYIKDKYKQLLDLLFYDNRISFATLIGQLSRNVICVRSDEVQRKIQQYITEQKRNKDTINAEILSEANKLGMSDNIESLEGIIKICKDHDFEKSTVIIPDNRLLNSYAKNLEKYPDYKKMTKGKNPKQIKPLIDCIIKKVYNEATTSDTPSKALITRMVNEVKRDVDYKNQVNGFTTNLENVNLRYYTKEPPSLIISKEEEAAEEADAVPAEEPNTVPAEEPNTTELIKRSKIISYTEEEITNFWTKIETSPKSPYECLIDENFGCIPGRFVYSESETFGDDLKQLGDRQLYNVFQHIDKFSRRWYDVNKEYATKNFYLYVSDNGEVRYFAKPGRHDNFTGGIADIYPAQKVVMFYMYFLLYPGLTKNHESINLTNDFRSLLAVYSLYVSLFNSFCSTIMETSWNTAISNEYVYNYYPINGQQNFGFMNLAYEARTFGDEIMKASEDGMSISVGIMPETAVNKFSAAWLHEGKSITTQTKDCKGKTHSTKLSNGPLYPSLQAMSPIEPTLKFSETKAVDDESLKALQNKVDEFTRTKIDNNEELRGQFKICQEIYNSLNATMDIFSSIPTLYITNNDFRQASIDKASDMFRHLNTLIDDISYGLNKLKRDFLGKNTSISEQVFGSAKRQLDKYNQLCTDYTSFLTRYNEIMTDDNINDKLILCSLSLGIDYANTKGGMFYDDGFPNVIFENAYNDGINYKNLTLENYIYYGQLIFKYGYVRVFKNLYNITNLIDAIFGRDCTTNNFSHLVKYYEIQGVNQITIPDSVQTIGEYCFSDCTSLTEITIPNSVRHIGKAAFAHCRALTDITIPSSIERIHDNCFLGCSSLTEITIPASVVCIGEGCLAFCSALCKINFIQNHNITSLPDKCFLGCSSLTEITIPESVVCIGEGCFGSCSSLTEITIPESVVCIGGRCFACCSSLTQITIPPGVNIIEPYTFTHCSSLTQITIPTSVQTIGDSAFAGCPTNM